MVALVKHIVVYLSPEVMMGSTFIVDTELIVYILLRSQE